MCRLAKVKRGQRGSGCKRRLGVVMRGCHAIWRSNGRDESIRVE